MKLTDKIWQNLLGAYKIPYDVSIPLRLLEKSTDPEIIEKIWNELWKELHHQGDVNLASYLAVPQIVRIGINNKLFDWNILTLCAVIEQQRQLEKNPKLPTAFITYYESALKDLKEYVIENLSQKLDSQTLIAALATIATCDGKTNIGKAILEMEDSDMLEDFLDQF